MKSVTAAIIISKEDEILITRRKPGSSLPGYWEFPGGKIEDGETPQECYCPTPYTKRPRLRPWKDIKKPIERLAVLQKHIRATKRTDPVLRIYLAQEKAIKEWLLSWPSVPPWAAAIEGIFEPGESPGPANTQESGQTAAGSSRREGS